MEPHRVQVPRAAQVAVAPSRCPWSLPVLPCPPQSPGINRNLLGIKVFRPYPRPTNTEFQRRGLEIHVLTSPPSNFDPGPSWRTAHGETSLSEIQQSWVFA